MLVRTDETVKTALRELSAAHGGKLSPQAVLDDARDPASALHVCFEWSDQVAAEKYRLVQARVLLRIVIETYDQSNEETIPIRMFTSVREMRGRDAEESPSYIQTALLLSTEDRRLMLVAQKLEQARFQISGVKDERLTAAYRFLSRLIERVDRERGLIR